MEVAKETKFGTKVA